MSKDLTEEGCLDKRGLFTANVYLCHIHRMVPRREILPSSLVEDIRNGRFESVSLEDGCAGLTDCKLAPCSTCQHWFIPDVPACCNADGWKAPSECQECSKRKDADRCRVCPGGCGRTYQHAGGCNCMTCDKCDIHFCMACGKNLGDDIAPAYDHFGVEGGCPLYTTL